MYVCVCVSVYIYIYIYIYIIGEWSPCGICAEMLLCNIVEGRL